MQRLTAPCPDVAWLLACIGGLAILAVGEAVTPFFLMIASQSPSWRDHARHPIQMPKLLTGARNR